MYRIISRFREPSTYAGFSALALALGLSVEQVAGYGELAAAVLAVIAIICRDPGSEG